MQNSRLEGDSMNIYVYTGDYRSYGFEPSLWGGATVSVEVPDDFQGGAKHYNPETGIWTDDPEAPVDYVAIANGKLAELREDAAAKVSDWVVELTLGIISDEDKAELIIWQKYIQALRKVDTSTAPDIAWPEIPE
ncbi:tail fiber assembly protein [Kosakonia oryzae]|uniref:Tail fiber assembly protein n=2 Tax=Enterobacteriaceae TaxID=543 RepID=A0AA94H432_9ENTR|nr:tail fiber assembly protein [Kosakonia radicincitans]ANI82425.2 tail fiber assembly protein [Kosakonia oryzae]SFC57676.1 virus tail fibre assembly protein, lambda gpK [Kosakonia oryzae]